MSKYKITYWSTRQKHGVMNPYGSYGCSSEELLQAECKRLKESKDIYMIETWEQTSVWDREPVVEEWTGNPAHLNLKGATKCQ